MLFLPVKIPLGRGEILWENMKQTLVLDSSSGCGDIFSSLHQIHTEMSFIQCD